MGEAAENLRPLVRNVGGRGFGVAHDIAHGRAAVPARQTRHGEQREGEGHKYPRRAPLVLALVGVAAVLLCLLRRLELRDLASHLLVTVVRLELLGLFVDIARSLKRAKHSQTELISST